MLRAGKVYEAVLQHTLSPLADPSGQTTMMAFSMRPEPLSGASGALVKMDGVASGGNRVIPCFGCNDWAAETSRVVAAGGKIQQPKMAIGEYGHIALAVDTEGNMIGLHSMA
jgi:uncharacterized protein